MLGIFGWGLGRKNPDYLRMCWYAFYLAACATAIVLFLARQEGAFNSKGEPVDGLGNAIARAIVVFGDLSDEGWLLGGFLALSILPQVLTYVTCGGYGHAPRTIMFREPLYVATIFYLKSIVGICGMVFVLFPFASNVGWISQPASETVFLMMTALGLVACILAILVVIAYRAEILCWLFNLIPRRLRRILKVVHNFFVRHETPSDPKTESDENVTRLRQIEGAVAQIMGREETLVPAGPEGH